MKILHIINSLATGGAEKLLLETLPIYREKGVIVDILLLNGKKHPFYQQLKKLNSCNIYSIGEGSVYNPVHFFRIIPYLKKYDIVHAHLFPAQYWVVMAKLISFSKVKLVFTEHNTTNRRLENKIFKFVDKLFYKGYDKIICITQEINDILQRHTGLSSSAFEVIENGVNLGVIQKACPLGKNEINNKINQSDSLLIQVAGFREQKDQSTLIRSLQYMPKNIKLILVGDGVLLKECEDLVNELQLQNSVFFLGLSLRVPELLKTSDVVVLSSKYEGLSLSSIEGMASGRPFVASDVPGLAEIVKGYGVLFQKGNAKELAEKILKLLNDKEYYGMVAEACLARASQYDIYKMVNQHILLYEILSKD